MTRKGNSNSLEPYFDADQSEPPETDSNRVMKSERGALGVANPSPHFAPANNMSPSALGGDNRTDLGRFAVAGNQPWTEHEFGWKGDDRFMVKDNPTPEEVKGWFRGGSDALGGGR